MQDFAYLFPDSVAAWLRGRGDGRFTRYERHYRIDRSNATSPETFDLEQSNFRFSQKSRKDKGPVTSLLKSKPFAAFATFLILLWGGTALLSSIGASQPVGVAVMLGSVFIGLRMKHFRARRRR